MAQYPLTNGALFSLLCDASLGFLSFSRTVLGASIGRGTIYLEWGKALLIPFDTTSSFDCEDPVYNVFLAEAPFNFTDFSIPELIELSDASDVLTKIKTEALEIMLTDQTPNETLSVLVIAIAENRVFSEMNEGIEITVSKTDAVLNRNVTKIMGPFESNSAFVIDYKTSSGFLEFLGEIPSEIYDVEEMS